MNDLKVVETKKFRYQIEIEAIPYNKETAKDMFGTSPEHIDEYNEDLMARQIFHDMIRDAINGKLELRSLALKIKDDTFGRQELIDYLMTQIDMYEQIEKTIKRIE